MKNLTKISLLTGVILIPLILIPKFKKYQKIKKLKKYIKKANKIQTYLLHQLRSVNADRVSIFQIENDEISMTFEATEMNIIPNIKQQQNINLSTLQPPYNSQRLAPNVRSHYGINLLNNKNKIIGFVRIEFESNAQLSTIEILNFDNLVTKIENEIGKF